MSIHLSAIPVCDDQLDLLSLVVDEQTPIGSLHANDFRQACWQDAKANGGWVHPSRVHLILHNRFNDVNVRWFSAMWAGSCGPNGYMTTTDIEAPIDARLSKGNGNKTVKLRKWRGVA